jgi:hypothetical protein
LAQVLGELGAAVGRRHPILVDGEVEANAAELRKILSARRYLVVLDGPEAAHVAALGIDTGQPLGRTSVLMTPGLRAPWETPRTLGYARWLMEGRRFAEAYELLQSLAEAGAEKASIARELAWICEQWDRVDEGRYWRDQCAPLAPAKPAGPGEQMGLF